PSVVRIDPEVRGDGGQRSVAADDENASIAGMNPQDVLRLRLVEDHQDEADLVVDDSHRRSARLGTRLMGHETQHLRSLRSKLLITGGGKDAQSSLLVLSQRGDVIDNDHSTSPPVRGALQAQSR